jgi:hypothetical protein
MHSFDHDKELDQLTKTAAEAIEAPSQANWDKMQRALDKELPQQKKRRGGIIWWFLPTLLVVGLGYYWLNSPSKQLKIEQKNNETDYNSNQATKKIIRPETVNPKSLTTDKTIFLAQASNKNKVYSSIKEVNKNIEQDSKNEFQAPSNRAENKAITNSTTCCKEISIKTTNHELNTRDTATQSVEIKAVEKLSTNQITKSESNYIGKKETNNLKGFFIGLVGGFDASTVKFKYKSNVGYNFGGILGYRFNKHWSLQSGAIFTQKNYKLNGQDFHPPKGSWISYYEIETVDGYCKMWDVPIIATYHFTGNSNGNSFLSVGASSYFMKNENYNYLYFYNNQYYTRTNNYKSTDQHLLGLLHISAGIERPIGKNITSIIEPYAKIPLTGVGFGSIQLSSFGLNFSVQYRQPKK